MPMDLELERLREERLKEMKEKQGFVDIRSVVDVRDSGIVRNKEVVSLSIPYLVIALQGRVSCIFSQLPF